MKNSVNNASILGGVALSLASIGGAEAAKPGAGSKVESKAVAAEASGGDLSKFSLPSIGDLRAQVLGSHKDLSESAKPTEKTLRSVQVSSYVKKDGIEGANTEQKGKGVGALLLGAFSLLGMMRRSPEGSRSSGGGSRSADPVSSKDSGAESEKQSTNWKQVASRLWGLWEKPCNMLPSPWNTVAKYGAPILGATVGVVWFNAVVQIGVATLQLFGGALEPVLGTAAFLVPMVAANKILSGVEKLLHMEPISGWKRQAILRPIQAGLLIGATVWTLSIGLSPVTYAAWAGGILAAGYLVRKVFPSTKAATWAAVGTALVLPWSHLITQRTFDVTVLDASPDPELAAWNVTTDLAKGDHWKRIMFFKDAPPPSGKSGMVFLNRDVPLYFPPHREANEFHGAFANLVGQKVRVTTIGAWLKPLSDKLQPTIVKFEVLPGSKTRQEVRAEHPAPAPVKAEELPAK